ncbi:MAG: nuclear transport factor 2 family protein [Puniceicoccaceae bacterium]
MSPITKQTVVEHYYEGFRTGNPECVLKSLADDIVWRAHGCSTIHGRDAFRAEIDNEEFKNTPTLNIDKVIESDAHLVVLGSGKLSLASGGPRGFTFCEVFLISDDRILEIDTFHMLDGG